MYYHSKAIPQALSQKQEVQLFYQVDREAKAFRPQFCGRNALGDGGVVEHASICAKSMCVRPLHFLAPVTKQPA
jgi:hypothetical protein